MAKNKSYNKNYKTVTQNYRDGKLISSVQKVKNGDNITISTTTNPADIQKEIKRERLQQKRERRQLVSEATTLGTGLFSIVLFILMLAVFARFAFSNSGQAFPTLEGLLDMFSNFRSVPNDFLLGINNSLHIFADWGIFNGLRDVINFLGGCVSFIVWIVSGLFNVVSFALTFIAWIFGF